MTAPKLTEAQRSDLSRFMTSGARYTSATADLTTLEELLALGFVKRVTYAGQTATWNLIWNITDLGRAALKEKRS
jgi:hypothetical protein